MTAFAERFRNEGLEQGLAKGEATGLQKALLAQLRLKFGDSVATQNVHEKIAQADHATLLRWLGNMLGAQSVAEVFK